MFDRPFSDISYDQFLSEKKLMGSKCKACDAVFVPPRSICVKCYSSDMQWVEMKGSGRLAAFTCITVAPPFMIDQGYNRNNPYISGVVELEEGGRVDARIEGVDPTRPDDIKVGMPLKVKYLHHETERKKETYLAFEPV